MALTVVHIQVLNNIFMFFTRLRLSQPLDVGQHPDMNKVGYYSEMLMAPVDSDWDEIIWTRRNFHVIEASSIFLHSAALASSRQGADGNYVNTNVSTNKETSHYSSYYCY